ncbi:MAG: tRNA uridine(34) 5-carboxymethylaminomethyl modification radical SAM/GNAT enzyme Elp3 [Nanoarchaeota archaeon]|nr:tRNA uridine(34) 5-carboxymethylaminomethyl modification radical SAM/GNAT enzyme Elp3 [Nanoarchaeota archaeon]
MSTFYKEIFDILKEKKLSIDELNKLKTKLSKKFNLRKIPTNIEILMHCSNKEYYSLKKKLMTKPTRTGSGVAVISIMTMPKLCPHAKSGVGPCIMCPGGPDSAFGDIPQSYTGREPATMRGIRNNFDPYLQIWNRLEQYMVLGQNPEKVELIIMGGTFPSYEKEYKKDFIVNTFKALNDFSDYFFTPEFDLRKFRRFFELPGNITDPKRTKRVQKRILKLKKDIICSIAKEQKKNEKSHIRCVGLTIETRPDYAMLEHANELLKFGTTRVELGVQTTDDNVLELIHRGHSVQDSIDSTRILKDLGFKINYHVMPGLPGAKDDLKMMKQILDDENFRPDMLKIYPAMVLKGTKLYDEWKNKRFTPITTDEAAILITEFKKHMKKWIRVMRVQRDIPTEVTEAGVDRTNLRQYVHELMGKKGVKCCCIRCREPKGRTSKELEIIVQEYDANKGKEYFISIEDVKKDILFGFCRLRFPSQELRKEITNKTALIRELHVYGEAEKLGKTGKVQHKGYGKLLLEEAEKIAKKHGKDKIVVISGVGVRDYYRKLGYKKEGVYMVKEV